MKRKVQQNKNLWNTMLTHIMDAYIIKKQCKNQHIEPLPLINKHAINLHSN